MYSQAKIGGISEAIQRFTPFKTARRQISVILTYLTTLAQY